MGRIGRKVQLAVAVGGGGGEGGGEGGGDPAADAQERMLPPIPQAPGGSPHVAGGGSVIEE